MRRSISTPILALFIVAACAVDGIAQRQSAPDTSGGRADGVRLDRTLITLDVTVQDRQGRFVSGLDMSSFTIFDDKIEQEIAFFREDDRPVTVGIVFDVSGSMKSKRRRAARALKAFVETCHEEDEYFVIGFNDRVELLRDLSPDPRIVNTLTLVDTTGRTSLYDATMAAIEKAREGRHDKRALLIISDGQDNHSRYTFKEVREVVREAGVLLYGIGISDPSDSLAPFGEGVLGELCRITGGKAYFPYSTEALAVYCNGIALELRHQYSIGYYPTSTERDGKWHKVKVKLTEPPGHSRLAVRTREGYYCPRW